MKRLLFFILMGIFISANAQFNSTFKKMYDKADGYIYEDNFIDALPLVLKMDSMVPNNANIQFLTGLCYLKSYKQKEKAIAYLEKASQSVSADYYGGFNETNAPVFTFYFLAKAYHYYGKFDNAIENYNKFKYYLTADDKDWQSIVERDVQMSLNAKKYIENPITIRTKNLGSQINTEYPEYAPAVSPDLSHIIFTSRRPGSTGGMKDDKGEYFEDIYIANYNRFDGSISNLHPLDGNVNTKGHEASISISWDGQILFIYKDDNGDGNIYQSKQVDGRWTAAEKLPAPVNTKNYENHAFLSPDGTKLFFVSNRPGGYGGKDIWMCSKNAKGNWDNAVNAGPNINTEYDEDAPIMLSDGKTMYFSSKGHETMGGYDIFYASFENNSWSYPKNIGYPLNTTDDDVFFVPTLDGKEAFYAKTSDEGFGSLDIYKITIDEDIKQMLVLSGFVRDTINNKALLASVKVFELPSDKLYAQAETKASDGSYQISIQSGSVYKVEVSLPDGSKKIDTLDFIRPIDSRYNFNIPFYFGTPMLTAKVDTIVNRINVGQRMGDRFVLRNVYFDFDKATLRPESKEELNKLVELLTILPTVKIEISGHTDNKGSEAYNVKLSEDRSKAVVEYLVAAGISADRLSYKGYGFSQPIASNETDAGRQLNRRTEFKIIGYKSISNINSQTSVVNSQMQSKDNVLVDYKPRFYIIGGSFMFMKNAERFRDELIMAGYKDAEVVGMTTTGSYRVAYKGYDSREEAFRDMPNIAKTTERADLWVLQK